MSRLRELVSTFVVCGLAVAAVTLVATEREPADWRFALACTVGVTVGTAIRQVFDERGKRRHPAGR